MKEHQGLHKMKGHQWLHKKQ